MLAAAQDVILDWLRSWGELSSLTAVGLSIVFIVASFGVPRVFLNVTAGAVFGPWCLLVIQPSTAIGAVLAFLAARYLVADWTRRRIEAKPLLRATAQAIDEEGWRIVALMRLASPVPSSLANYAFGVTRIDLGPYAIATFVFTLPQNVLHVYLGATGRAMLVEDVWSPLQLLLLLAGMACMAIVTLMIARRTRVALRSPCPTA
jgi:uncharacterized membrane protein YdjX (TVP38/TMEM64 family)